MENEIEVKVFTESYTDKLYRDIKATSNLDAYYLEKFPYEERFPKGKTNIFLPTDLELNPKYTAEADLESSISLYNHLNLNETQASDPRLWTYLTHVTFWKYMRERWGLENVRAGDEPLGRVIDRYLLLNPRLESLTRNGLSRLWWYAHLTYDKNSQPDPFHLTRVLLKRQDVAVGILERLIGANSNTRLGILTFLKENETILKDEKKTRELLKNLNLYGGPKVLPILSPDEVKDLLEYIAAA